MKPIIYRLYPNTTTNTRRGRHYGGDPDGDRNIPVFDILPWPINRERYLPNFFTQPTANNSALMKNSNVIFLHHNKAGGTTIKSILSKYARRSHQRLTVLSNAEFKRQRTIAESHKSTRHKEIYVGGYAFGICDLLPATRPCSYFTLVRNPYSRIISSYFYCQKRGGDQLCGPVRPADVGIEAWAIHQGSYFFRQLLVHPDIRLNDPEKYSASYKNRTNHIFKFIGKSQSWWFVEKSYLQEEVSVEERRGLLKYCLDNLEKWFTVVGILEEYALSLRMLEVVYGIPFSEKEDLQKNVRSSSPQDDAMIDDMKRTLEESDAVREALQEDLAIYNRLYDIFNRQRDVLLSRESWWDCDLENLR